MLPNNVQIKQKARDLGFHLVGIAATAGEDSDRVNQNRLQAWLAAGNHADMSWMAAPRRRSVRACWPQARSVICLALNYYTPHQHPPDPQRGKVSRYGWGRDYHRVLHKKLKALMLWLQECDPSIQGRYYADTGPIQDKVWAERAGLGWIAKNGNLITREYGSWVFLGEVLVNFTVEPDRPHTQHCGTCTRCLEACPTEAIVSPFTIDSNRCIAYHTIENRAETLPAEVDLAGWVAGCDVCQDVCPWNQRFARETDIADFHPYADNVAPKLAELATLSETDWERRFPASALRRIKPWMWQRNARANLAKLDPAAASETPHLDSNPS